MKKAVIIILAILPIFLAITISFAARILSIYEHIDVEKVMFVNEDNEEYGKEYIFKIEVGEEKQTKIKILPTLATNKNVSYVSDNEAVCTVNSEGVIKGIGGGTATIVVKTEDGGKTSMIRVKVTQEKVTGISLPYEEVTLVVGESILINAEVIPHTALNKKVEYYSESAVIATVDKNGKVTAVAEGETTIMVFTEEGGFAAKCKVICVSGTPALSFDISGSDILEKVNDFYKINVDGDVEINLLDYLRVDPERVNIEDVKFEMNDGKNIASLENNKLIVNGYGKPIRIFVYVGEKDNPTYQLEIIFGRLQNIT